MRCNNIIIYYSDQAGTLYRIATGFLHALSLFSFPLLVHLLIPALSSLSVPVLLFCRFPLFFSLICFFPVIPPTVSSLFAVYCSPFPSIFIALSFPFPIVSLPPLFATLFFYFSSLSIPILPPFFPHLIYSLSSLVQVLVLLDM